VGETESVCICVRENALLYSAGVRNLYIMTIERERQRVCVYVCMCVCIYLCVCVCERERDRKRVKESSYSIL